MDWKSGIVYVARVTGWNPNSRIPSKKLDDIRGRLLCLYVERNLVAIAGSIMIMNVLTDGKKLHGELRQES